MKNLDIPPCSFPKKLRSPLKIICPPPPPPVVYITNVALNLKSGLWLLRKLFSLFSSAIIYKKCFLSTLFWFKLPAVFLNGHVFDKKASQDAYSDPGTRLGIQNKDFGTAHASQMDLTRGWISSVTQAKVMEWNFKTQSLDWVELSNVRLPTTGVTCVCRYKHLIKKSLVNNNICK